MVSMMKPDSSWVARWLSMKYIDGEGRPVLFKPGLYAISLPSAKASAEAEAESEYEEDEEEEGAGGGAAADGMAPSSD